MEIWLAVILCVCSFSAGLSIGNTIGQYYERYKEGLEDG